MNSKRLFHSWLCQKSILKQFKYNLRSVRDPNSFEHSPNIRNNVYTEPRWFICDAFVWEETNEGYDFWSHIDSSWAQFLERKYPSLI
jgi:hypothetical protein